MANAKLDLIVTLKDKASKQLGKFGGVVDRLNTKLIRFAKIGIAGVAGALVLSVKKAAAFETKMANISTLIAGDSTKAISELRTGILELTKVLPKTADDLGASAYAILSAGITDTTEALDLLEASTRLAVAGLGTTEEATTLMTLATNNFRDSSLTAEEKANVLFKTIGAGITTVADMQQSFGLLAPLIADAGISFEEMSAATGALTQINKSASISQNEIKAALVSMSKPTKEAIELFDKLGVKTFKELIKQSGGMVNAFDEMQIATEGNEVQFAQALGSAEGLVGVLSLLGGQKDAFVAAMDDMTGGTDVLSEAVEKQKDTFSSQFAILKNNLGVVMIELGTAILPALVEAFNNLKPEIEKLTTFFEENKEEITRVATVIVENFIKALVDLTRFVIENKDAILFVIEALIALKVFMAGAALLNAITGVANTIGGVTKAISAAGGLIPALSSLAGALAVPFLIVVAIGSIIVALVMLKNLIETLGELEEQEARLKGAISVGNLQQSLIDRRNRGELSQKEFERRFRLTGRADGGPVTKGGAFIVGEEGPELFIPNSSGQIISNDKIRGDGGINITINGNINNNEGLTVQEIVQQIARQLELSRQGGF